MALLNPHLRRTVLLFPTPVFRFSVPVPSGKLKFYLLLLDQIEEKSSQYRFPHPPAKEATSALPTFPQCPLWRTLKLFSPLAIQHDSCALTITSLWLVCKPFEDTVCFLRYAFCSMTCSQQTHNKHTVSVEMACTSTITRVPNTTEQLLLIQRLN